MGVAHPGASAIRTGHQAGHATTTTTTAPTSFVGSLLHAHRCHVCRQVMIPRLFQATSKGQRTCGTCHSVVCTTCFKQQAKATAPAGGSFVCAVCLRHPPSRWGLSACDAQPVHRMVVHLRMLFAQQDARHREATLWHLICAYAFDPSECPRHRGGRHLFLAWRRSWMTSVPMLVDMPPLSCDAANATPDDGSGGDDSPRARIPDFSEALAATSGRIFTALACNTVGASRNNQPTPRRCTHGDPLDGMASPDSTHLLHAPAHRSTGTGARVVSSSAKRPLNAAKTMQGGGTMRTHDALMSPIVHRRPSNAAASTTPRPSGQKEFLVVPKTARASLSPLSFKHPPAGICCSAGHLSARGTTAAATTPEDAARRRTHQHQLNRAGGPSMSPLTARGTMSDQQRQQESMFMRTDSTTVSPLVFRAPRRVA